MSDNVTRVRYAQFSEESEFNPSTTPDVQYTVDIVSSGLDVPGDTDLVYEGGLGRSSRTRRPGFYSPEGDVVYAFDIKTIAFMLKMALGGYKYTSEGGGDIPDTDPTENFNLHEIWGTNDSILPSFTTRIGKDHFEHVFKGCVIDSLEINVEGEYAQATASINSAVDAKATIKTIEDIVDELPGEYPLAFYDLTSIIQNDGSDEEIRKDVKSFTLTINNNLDAEAGRGMGSRHPQRIIANNREITGSLDLFYKNTDAIEKIWGGSEGPSNSGATEFEQRLKFESGEYGEMEIEMPRVVYTSVEQQPSGTDELVVSASFKAYQTDLNKEGGGDLKTEILVTVENTEGEIEAD